MSAGRLLTTAAALAVAAISGAAAAPPPSLSDSASGLTVQPPEGYEAKVAEADPRYAAVFAVQKGGEEETGCKVAFQAAPPEGAKAGEQPAASEAEAQAQKPAPTQDEINAFVRKKEWTDLIRATLALRYDVATLEPFEHGGVVGAAAVADFKPIEGEPRASEVRSYLVLIDTPKGRTTVVCVGEKASFAARKPEFEAVARGVTPPK